ncbi:unnamed protein product [Blepharisma stoltei]|uniref:Recombination activating protein 1 n=1 Tax=Blepharisma stoltei TaxID=1481888 RepID=A0AAU9KP42_9CILI|nr:unnamed protein product [Blepharisma stoltei]
METPSIFQRSLTTASNFEDGPDAYPPYYPHKKNISKKSAKYIIEPKENFQRERNCKQAKNPEGRAVMPYSDDSDSQIDDGWNRGCNLVHAETIRENPADNLQTIINRSKTRAERQENARQYIIRIAKCKKCKRLSYIKDGICHHCNQGEHSTLKSMVLGSALCCCNFLTE